MKKISIVICTYNGSKNIRSVILSLLSQKKLEESVSQILIVDNASKDNTRQIIYELMEVNSIVNYVYEEKAGLSNARKHGANVDTEWVIYLDDDNLVSENWLSSTLDFILDNTEIGVFNCAIVGELDFQPDDNEKLMYQAFYKYLACSHENIEEYKKGLKPSFGGPVGAGMGLKVAPLKEYLAKGWTSNIGRKGTDLGSGEDGELANFVLSKGYKYKMNLGTYVTHIIPKERLQSEYMKKLIKGLEKGYYNFISNKPFYIFYRLRMLLKSVLYIPILIFMPIFVKSKKRRLIIKTTIGIRWRLIKYILKDLIIFRKI